LSIAAQRKETRLKTRIVLIGAAVACTAAIVGGMEATAKPKPAEGDEGGVAAGPDVIVGALHNYSKYGSVTASGKTISAYSFGTTSCNIGNQQLLWQQNTTLHPVIPQNAYRVKNGRMEQIGQSWIKHGFCALQGTLCGACTPAGPGCPPVLGIGCSDPYDSTLNGDWTYLGPRSQVNAATGVFPYPFSSPAIPATIGRRVQIDITDLNPAMNTGAVYFAEGQYVHPQDAASGNGENNASYRQFTVGTLTGGSYNLTLTGATIQQKPAIFAWQTVHPDVVVQKVSVPSDGVFHLAYRTIDLGGGVWRYEYAVHNLNSDRSGGSFSIPIPAGVTINNVGFKDIDYHSNEVYDNTDWTWSLSGGNLTWSSTQTFAQNANANALRWATMYNFWFDATTAPQNASATIGLFKPGTPTTVAAPSKGPSPLPFAPGDLNQDGVVNGADLALLLGAWGTPNADINGDGTTDGSDLALLLGNWTP